MEVVNKNPNLLAIDEIQKIGKSILKKSFREIHSDTEIVTKGGFGHFIEKYVYNLSPNSDPSPDFEFASTELKVTPIRKNKNRTYSAKERLVLNIINYEKEINNTFYTSTFWSKNSILYIFFYLYIPNIDKMDYIILKDLLLDFSKMEKDLLIIKKDWEIIHNKIVEGKAHEISEADTLYLGACTKGVSSKSMRTQPNSDILAKQRAYSLKQSYMTQIFNRKPLHKSIELIVDALELEKLGFEQIIENKLQKYIGLSQDTLKSKFGITSKSKNLNELLVAAMLGLKNTKISKTEEFLKANIVPKTIRVEENNTIKEHMSFSPFKFTDIVEEKWNDSETRDYFESTKFMFVIFKKNNGEYIFKGIKFWNMPVYDIENDLRDVWEKTTSLLKSGTIIKEVKSKTYNFFPKAGENRVAHIRPHGQNSKDEFPLPYPDNLTKKTSFTKQSFWLNKSYILDIIKDVITTNSN